MGLPPNLQMGVCMIGKPYPAVLFICRSFHLEESSIKFKVPHIPGHFDHNLA
jgi:hypothetical protein